MSLTEGQMRDEIDRVRGLAQRFNDELILMRAMVVNRDQIFNQMREYLAGLNLDNSAQTTVVRDVLNQMINCKLDVQINTTNKESEQEQSEPEGQSNAERRLGSIGD